MGLKSPWGQPHAGSSPAPGMMDNYQTRMYAELSPDARRLFHALAGLMTPDEWRAGGDLLPNGGRGPLFYLVWAGKNGRGAGRGKGESSGGGASFQKKKKKRNGGR